MDPSDTFSSKALPPKCSIIPKTAPPTGDQIFKHMRLWGMFLMQATTNGFLLKRKPKYHNEFVFDRMSLVYKTIKVMAKQDEDGP